MVSERRTIMPWPVRTVAFTMIDLVVIWGVLNVSGSFPIAIGAGVFFSNLYHCWVRHTEVTGK